MTLVFIVPMVGLAIDAGILYTVKGKLQMAVDAASLAAARALSRGNDDATQQTNAIATAEEYVLLNFPTGYFNVSTPTFATGASAQSRSMRVVANQQLNFGNGICHRLTALFLTMAGGARTLPSAQPPPLASAAT